jgi:hypothetical protein
MARAETRIMYVNIFANHQPDSNRNLQIAVRRVFDMDDARRLFAGLEALAREARTTGNPRVMLDALRVLELQPANVRELLAQEVCRVR